MTHYCHQLTSLDAQIDTVRSDEVVNKIFFTMLHTKYDDSVDTTVTTLVSTVDCLVKISHKFFYDLQVDCSIRVS